MGTQANEPSQAAYDAPERSVASLSGPNNGTRSLGAGNEIAERHDSPPLIRPQSRILVPK